MKMEQGVGNNIRDERKKRGLTQAQLAEKIGVAQTTVANWENDTRNASVKNLQKIADALEIPIANLAVAVVYRNGEFVKDDSWLDGERIARIAAAERVAKIYMDDILKEIPEKYFLGEIMRIIKRMNRFDLYRVHKYVTELADS